MPLDRLERKWGDMFSKVFRSITVDNGGGVFGL